MKNCYLGALLIFLGISCGDDSKKDDDTVFQFGYETPKELKEVGTVVADDHYLVACSQREGDDAGADYSLILTRIDFHGKVEWSKKFTAASESIYLDKIEKVAANEYTILGQIGVSPFVDIRPFILTVDGDGAILSSYRLKSDEPLRVKDISVLPDGSFTFSGDSYNGNNKYNLTAGKISAAHTVLWAKKFTPYTYSSKIGASSDGYLIANCNATGKTELIKLDLQGGVENSYTIIDNSQKSSDVQGLVSAQGSFFIAVDADQRATYLIKSSSSGSYEKSVHIALDICDLAINDASLLAVMDYENKNKFFKTDLDFGVLEEKLLAHLVGANSTLKGAIGVGEKKFAYTIGPLTNEPSFGRRGFNLVTLDNSTLEPRCVLYDEFKFALTPQTFLQEPLPVDAQDFQITIENFELSSEPVSIIAHPVCPAE